GQIIGVEGHKVGAQADIPGISEASPGFELFHEFVHEGRVLMVHVGAQKAVAAEGENLSLDKNPQHDEDREKKGQEKRCFLQHRGFLAVLASESEFSVSHAVNCLSYDQDCFLL